MHVTAALVCGSSVIEPLGCIVAFGTRGSFGGGTDFGENLVMIA